MSGELDRHDALLLATRDAIPARDAQPFSMEILEFSVHGRPKLSRVRPRSSGRDYPGSRVLPRKDTSSPCLLDGAGAYCGCSVYSSSATMPHHPGMKPQSRPSQLSSIGIIVGDQPKPAGVIGQALWRFLDIAPMHMPSCRAKWPSRQGGVGALEALGGGLARCRASAPAPPRVCV